MVRRRKKMSKFRDKVQADTARQKARSSQYGYLRLPKGVSMFREDAPSRIRLDILPYAVKDPVHPDRDDEREIAVPESLWYKRPYKLHRNVGAANEAMVCPGSIGKKCAVCEHRAKMLAEGSDWQDDAVKALKASDRNLYVVVPIGHKDYDQSPHVWDISQFNFQNQLNEELEEDIDSGAFPDLEEGLTLRVRFSEEQIGKNKFASTSRIDFEERKKQYDDSILDDVPCLDDLLSVPSYEQTKAKFYETEETEDLVDQDEASGNDDDDSDATVRRGRRARFPVEEEEEEEEIKPRSRRRRKEEREEKQTCPYGHKFGEDCDEYEDCESCEIFEACLDAREKMEE